MKESKIILLESSVKGNKEPFPPKTTHSPCCSFAAAESVIISHIIRWDQLLLFPWELMQKLDRKQTEGKDIWKVGREFPKIHLHFGTSFCSSTHAIDNRNLCKQGKATLPIISVSSDRELSRKCTENWQPEKPSSCVIRVLPDTNTRTSWLQRLKCPRDTRTLNNLGFGKFTSWTLLVAKKIHSDSHEAICIVPQKDMNKCSTDGP